MARAGICPGLEVGDSSEESVSSTINPTRNWDDRLISDSEIPPGALDDEDLEEFAKVNKKNEDYVDEKAGLLMAKLFEGMEHPTALAIRKEVIDRKCPKHLLQGISNSLESHQTNIIVPGPSKDGYVLKNQNDQPLPQDKMKESKVNFWPFQKEKIQKSVESTWKSAVKPVNQKISGLYFDYHDLQAGIRLQFEKEANSYLWRKLFEKRDVQEKKRPPKCEWKPRLLLKQKGIVKMIEKEFQQIYGPMQMSHPTVQAYFKQYFEGMKEKREEIQRRLLILREIVSRYGDEKVRSLLRYQKIGLQKLEDGAKANSAGNKITYNLNPLTNLAHLDWFLVPRPKIDEGCIVMNHPALWDQLFEYQPTKEDIQSSITISGYWLSLLDLGATKGVNISEDIVHDTGYPNSKADSDLPEEARLKLRKEEGYWNKLLKQMTNEIALHPLGILAEMFLRKVKIGIRLLDESSLFGKVSTEKALKLMTDVWVVRKFPLHRDDEKDEAKKRYRTLLFPAHLRGILPNDIRKIMLRVLRRIIFLLESAPEEGLDLRSVEELHRKYFNIRLKFGNWGFHSVESFIDWCKEQWGEGDGGRVKLSGIVGRKGEHYIMLA